MNLKKIRMGVSAAVFILFLLTFLGNETISAALSDTLLHFQLIPSLLQFIHSPGGLAGLCLFIILLASLVFGRFYCSFLCPLGMLQDILIRIFRPRGKKHTYLRSYPKVSCGLLFLTIILALIGSLSLLNLLDPYSLFGRMAAHPFKTLVLEGNNMIVNVLEQFDIYGLTFKRQHHIPISILAIAMGSFGIVLMFSVISGRGYCNTICPLGAFLGIVSRFSFFRFVIDKEKCRSCRLCEDVCKAGCIDLDKLEIDASRCVTCFNCTDTCRNRALEYKYQFPIPSRQRTPYRRRFLLISAAAGGTFLSAALPIRLTALEAMGLGKAPIMPPGARRLSDFIQRCTACHLCVSVCPTNVMTPAYLKYGIGGIMQPQLDYRIGHCDFECHACGQVCPTGAITSLSLQKKKLTRIGTVSLNKTKCIVHVKKKHCGACGEACPTHAIFPVEKGLVLFPEINTDYCIGCGACEHACPTQPKAITIISEIAHSKAIKYIPPASATPLSEENGKDFPF